jgi:DNA-directed RNA polymerase subunit RPC12/RpoP
MKIIYICATCKKYVRKKHFTAIDGRILCYKCRIKEKVLPMKSKTK